MYLKRQNKCFSITNSFLVDMGCVERIPALQYMRPMMKSFAVIKAIGTKHTWISVSTQSSNQTAWMFRGLIGCLWLRARFLQMYIKITYHGFVRRNVPYIKCTQRRYRDSIAYFMMISASNSLTSLSLADVFDLLSIYKVEQIVC